MLCDLAESYHTEAVRVGVKIALSRNLLRCCTDPEQRAAHRHKIAALQDIQTQCYALAKLCKRYYDRDYYRNPDYTSNGWGGDKFAGGV